MATTTKWTAYGSAITLATGTSMNALADASWVLGSAIDNGTDLYLYMDIELVLSSAVAAGSGSPSVDVYLLPSCDGGTTYPTPPGGTAGSTPAKYFVGAIPANASANFTSGVLRGVLLPPGYYKVEIQNNLGVAFPSTDTSTLKGYPYYEQGV